MIRNRLKKLRSEKSGVGISLEQLARKVGISRSHLCRIENGKRYPSVDTMFRLASYFGRGVEEVFYVESKGQG